MITTTTSSDSQLFEIDTLACEELNPAPYQKDGSFILLPADDICPIAKKSFRELREANLASLSQLPYAITYIQCQDGGLFCDGPAAVHWLNDQFIHPQTKQTVLKVYLFAQGVMRAPFLYITSCTDELSNDMLSAGRAFSLENTEAVQAARSYFLTQRTGLPRFKMHFQDLIPVIEAAHRHNPKDPQFLMLLASIYYAGTQSVPRDFARAAFFYERALALAPHNTTILYRLGEMYRLGDSGLAKNLKTAKRYLRQSYAINPHDTDTLASRVKLYCEYKPYKALELLKIALRRNPDNQFAREWLEKLSHDTSMDFREPVFRIESTSSIINKFLPPKGSSLCPLAKKTFHELRNAHFKASAFPYTIACIETKTSSLFCDGVTAIRWLEKQFTHPLSGEKCERVSLFVQGLPTEPFLFITNCDGILSPEMRHAALAFSIENSQEVHECRKTFLGEAMQYNIHRKDLIPLFERAILQYPQETSLGCSLANIYYMGSGTLKKNFFRAVSLLEAVIQIDPHHIFALIRLGEIWRHGGWGIVKNIPKAEAYLLKAYALNPTNNLALDILTELYCQNNEPQKALNILADARKVNPNNVFPINRQAQLFFDGLPGIPRDGGQAEKLWQEALHIEPNNFAIANRLANLYAHGRDKFPPNRPKAKQLFEEILKKDDGNIDALMGLGKMLSLSEEKSDLQHAEELLTKAHERAPNNDAPLAALGKLYYLGGPGFEPKPQLALANFEAALKINSQNQEVPELLGQLLLHGSIGIPPHLARAAQYLEQALAINPETLPILYKLAKLYLSGGLGVEKNIPRARKLLEKAYALAPKNPPIIKALSATLYDESCLQTGLQDRIVILRQALQIDPKNWSACATLGVMLFQEFYGIPAKEIEAIGFFEKANALHPLSVNNLILLGQFYSQGGKAIPQNYAKALAYFEEVIHRDEHNITAHSYLASLFFFGAKDLPENWAQAAQHCNRVLQCLASNIPAMKYLAEMSRLGGHGLVHDRKKALSLFDEIVNDVPYDCFALVGKSLLLLEDGDGLTPDPAKAISLLELAHDLNPNDLFTKSVLDAARQQSTDDISTNTNMQLSGIPSHLLHADRRASLRETEDSFDVISTTLRDLQIDTSTDEKSKK